MLNPLQHRREVIVTTFIAPLAPIVPAYLMQEALGKRNVAQKGLEARDWGLEILVAT
jgi:hypothetical protein